ncbi:MAG: PKD domain-containing protein, partial [Bacteroidales bacterium]|nr:PKD domain-containing protein [Bacteroidales bacterium]
ALPILPVVSFNFSNSCDYSPIAFDNTTAAVNTCIWIFGDGTTTNCTNPNIDVSHLYSAYGSYPVTLTVFSSLGCVDSLTQTAHVYPSPVAGFTTEDAQVCQQSASVFHNTSTSLGGTLSYLWDFGNGMSNTTPNPIIYYENSGDFTVTMIANSEHGCSDTIQHMVNISPLPLAAFDFNNTCLEDTIFFENMSSIIGGENLSYEWSFGDGTVSNDVNPAKIYDSEGTYLVILNVISESGCVGYVEHNVHVYPLPSVEFVCQPTCLGNASTFSNYSTTGLGTLTFQWDFGDGTNSTFSNPEHIYLSDGTFQAQLVAVTQYGCSDTMISSVIIHPKPNVEIGDEIYHCYNSYTIDAGNEGCVYHWSNNAASQTITVNTNGYYSVTVTNEFNCTDRDTVNIMLNMPVVVELGGDYQETCDSIVLNAGYPGAQFQWSTGATTQTITVSESGNYLVTVTSQGCTGDTATFIQVYTSPDINLGEDITECEGIDVELSQNLEFDQYSWSTGDTSSSIFVNVENLYALTVTDSHGCYASDEIMVYFNSLPITPFGSDTTVCGSVLLDALNSGAEFLWNDNTTSQHIMVSQSGNYSVTITGGNSCIISDDINIIVNPLPELSLGNDTALCLGELITLNAGDGFSSYLWSDLSTLETLTVGISGNYSVEVGNIYNCFSSDTISIVFNSNPNVNLGNNQFLCANQIALLNAGDDGEFFLWGSSNEFVSAEPQVMVADSGMYWVSVTNSFGCSSVDSVLVQYSEMSLTAYFLAASEAKRGDTVRFVDVSYPAPGNFLWSFGDGITSVEETPLHVYFVEGIFQVGLMVSNDYCVDTVSKIITISGTNKMFIPEDVEPAPSESLIEIISASLFPNPANNECYYELQLNRQTLVVLDLYDMRGRVLYSEHIDNASYVFKSLEVASLQPGMYFLRMRYSDKSETYKIIKQ